MGESLFLNAQMIFEARHVSINPVTQVGAGGEPL